MGGLILTAFVDVQLNRLEVTWRAHGRRSESWGMDHVILDGAVRHKEVWQKLRVELQRKFQHASGSEMRLSMGLIDGGHYAEDVYVFFRDLGQNPIEGVSGKLKASKGIGRHGHPIIDKVWRTVAKNLKGYHIGTWEAKDRIYERLRMDMPTEEELNQGAPSVPEGWMHFNKRFEEEYFRQLTVEQVVIKWSKGEEIRSYINPNKQRNEGLDLEVGCLAAFSLRRWNFDLIEAELLERVSGIKKQVEKKSRRIRMVTGAIY